MSVSSRMLLLVTTIILILLHKGWAEIAASADLNCDFASSCRWRNGTNGQEDSADFAAGQNLEMDAFHKITAIRPDQDDYFVYSYAMGGRHEAMLVSDVINCQLGGAQVKFWYWKTGKDVSLDVCIRQPPGNRDRAALKCYDGLSATLAQQWQLRAIELPPVSQPFELIFRAAFTAPLDIIAIDNIVYDAILCVGEPRRLPSSSSSYRSRRATSLQVMGLNEWRSLMTQNLAIETPHAPVMLIVGDNIPEPDETTTVPTTVTSLPTPTTSITTISASLNFPSLELLSSPTFPTLLPSQPMFADPNCPPDMALNEENSTTTTSFNKDETTPSVTSTAPITLPPDHMDNAFKFFKNIQPVLPYIPNLVRGLQSMDPRIAQATGTDPLVELNELSKIIGLDIVETASEIRRAAARPVVTPDEERVANLVSDISSDLKDNRYDGVLRNRIDGQTVYPIRTEPSQEVGQAPRSNIFGLERASRAPSFVPSTVYPPKLVKSLKTTVQRQSQTSFSSVPNNMIEETMDLSHLSTEEIKQLEEFHRKIFHKKGEPGPTAPYIPFASEVETAPPPLVVFKKTPKLELPAPPIYHPPVTDSSNSMDIGGGATSVADLLMEHMDDLKNVLPADALQDLSKLREIPDLDELTRGMDVSLINKPGGFAELKKQFMQRMIRRSLGLSAVDSSLGGTGKKKPLPPPIVPIKITRKAMMQAMRKNKLARTKF